MKFNQKIFFYCHHDALNLMMVEEQKGWVRGLEGE